MIARECQVDTRGSMAPTGKCGGSTLVCMRADLGIQKGFNIEIEM